MPVRVRPARPADGAFLAEMLVAAMYWRPGGPVGDVPSVLARPELAHYVVGWPLKGDLGVVADADVRSVGPASRQAVGAAWARVLPGHDPGYGFVSAQTPELSIGVRPGHRGQGVGSALLVALITAACRERHPALSLSVEPDNPARRLYERLGFQVVGAVDGSLTMLPTL